MADYYEDDAVPVDGREAQFSEWLDLDNKVRVLGEERRKIDKQLEELRPRLNRLGQRIANLVYPQDKPMAESSGDDW